MKTNELTLQLLNEFYRLKLRLDYPSIELDELYNLIKTLENENKDN